MGVLLNQKFAHKAEAQLIAVALLLSYGTAAAAPPQRDFQAQSSAPEFLSFDELVALSRTADPTGTLGDRLQRLLTTPFVRNEAGATDIKPHRPVVDGLGPIIRVGAWNLERGLNFDLIRSALADDAAFRHESRYENRTGNQRREIEAQLRVLQGTDILVFNEADLGMKRTQYRNVAGDLAAALRMNYAFAVEFVELDPLWDLDIEKIDLPDKAIEQRLEQDLAPDRNRYRGLHGNAVLSRYPIRRVRIVRLPACYDWYGKEVQAISKLEKGKRWSARKLFRERIEREVRHGGRMALIVDLAVPGVPPAGEVTVISAHLENRCTPSCRQKQISALLNAVQEVNNPVVLAGDLNTSGGDATPTSVRNEIMKRLTDYRFWTTQAIFWYSPVSPWMLFPFRYFHSYLDPTAWHLPFVWENRERGLFKKVEKFRFADGYAFDFRGKKERTLNGKGRTLADSNERGAKGFVPTYSFERTLGGWAGNYKLDWFFVKPFIRDPKANYQSYQMAPHFPITMGELNKSAEDRISDHPPMTVDLPRSEPELSHRSAPSPTKQSH